MLFFLETALVLVIQFRAILVASLILEVRGLFSRIAINPAERYRHSIAENQESPLFSLQNDMPIPQNGVAVLQH